MKKDKKIKVVLISSMQPYSNYSRNLAMGLVKEDIELIVYAEKLEKNKSIENCGKVKPLWDKNLSFFIIVFKELLKDRPDVIHIQHEFNMFGSVFMSVIMPFFVLLLKIFKAKNIVTIHAVVERCLIDRDFVKFFKGDKDNTPPVFLTAFFLYFYWLITFFSDEVIVHTNLLKKHLADGYYINPKKINVIPVATWIRFDRKKKKMGDYFYYFGYMVRRKGLKNVVDGFIKFIETTKNKDFKLLLGGGVIPGQEFARDELLELIKEHNLQDRIRYLGYLDEGEVEDYLANSYACVVPGVFTIAASGPLSHAYGYGKCVLASDIGYLAEEIEDGKDGILTDNNNWSDAFATAVSRIELVKSIEKNTEKKAKKRCNKEVAKMHLGVYRELGKKKTPDTKRILVLHRYPPNQVIGTNASFIEFLKELTKKGIEIYYLSYASYSIKKKMKDLNHIYIPLGFSRGKNVDKIFKTYLWVLFAPLCSAYIQRKHNIDLIYCD